MSGRSTLIAIGGGELSVEVHVLPEGYSFELEDRMPVAPKLTKTAANE